MFSSIPNDCWNHKGPEQALAGPVKKEEIDLLPSSCFLLQWLGGLLFLDPSLRP